jgi:hypothetical protein
MSHEAPDPNCTPRAPITIIAPLKLERGLKQTIFEVRLEIARKKTLSKNGLNRLKGDI